MKRDFFRALVIVLAFLLLQAQVDANDAPQQARLLTQSSE